MAMMMAGRVLLVCALCVLWCGAGGIHAGEVDKNLVGDCMASGVLGANRLRMPSVCDKVVISLPSRIVSSITAAEASTNDDASGIIGGNPESHSGAAAAGSVSGGAGGAGGSGGGGVTSGGSGDSAGGSDGNRNTSEDPKGGGGGSLQSPPSDDPNSPSIPNEVGDSQNTEVSLSLEKISPESAAGSPPTASPGNTPPKVETPDKSKPKEEEKEPSLTQAAAPISVNDKASTGDQNQQNDVGKVDHSSNQTSPPVPPSAVTSPVLSKEPATPRKEPSPSDASLLAPNAPQTTKGQEQKTSVLTAKMESKAPEIPSEDNVVQQQGQNTTTRELMETSSGGSEAETTTSSTFKSGTGEVQSTADADDDQRPNPSESQDDLEGTDINNSPTADEAAPQSAITLTTAQKNDTAMPGNSDGSTAVSHTTSPLLLLLLVVACAAAAVVVAA